MDQKKTELPHYKRLPKSIDSTALIGVHVVGVLVFNRILHAKAYLNYSNIRNDPNLTIAVIHDVLTNWDGPLPKVLYVQMDNTAAQNKNTEVFAYLSMLVHKCVFTKIKVGFLMVGHTHDQIDQMFSRFSVMLRLKKAFTLPDLISVLEQSYTPRPVFKIVRDVPDFREFLWPVGEAAVSKQLNNHSFQLQFKLTKKTLLQSDRDVIVLRAKEYSTTKFWDPEGGVELILQADIERSTKPAKVLPLRIRSRPRVAGEEEDARTVALRELDAIKAALHPNREHLTAEQLEWWDGFWAEQTDICQQAHGDIPPLTTEWTWPVRSTPVVEEAAVPDAQSEDDEFFSRRSRRQRRIYAGPRKSAARQALEAEQGRGDVREICVTDMVAVQASSDDRKGHPFWLGKVLAVDHDAETPTITVHWWKTMASEALEGRYSPEYKSVTPETGARPRKGKRKAHAVESIDTFPRDETNIMAYGFSLTRSKTLSKATAKLLQKKLFELRADALTDLSPSRLPANEDGSAEDVIDSADLDEAETTDASADLDAAQMSGFTSGEGTRHRRTLYGQTAGTSRMLRSPIVQGKLGCVHYACIPAEFVPSAARSWACNFTSCVCGCAGLVREPSTL